MRRNVLQLRNDYSRDNLACARIYAADPARYPGILQEWAAKVIAKHRGLYVSANFSGNVSAKHESHGRIGSQGSLWHSDRTTGL